jgi:hypothetical protein
LRIPEFLLTQTRQGTRQQFLYLLYRVQRYREML